MTSNQAVKVDVVDNKKNKGKKLADKSIRAFVDVNKVKDLIGGGGDLEEAVKQLQTEMENAISMVQQYYGIPHYSLHDLPDGTGWNSTASDNFSVLGVDSPSDLFQGQCPPFVLDCSQLGSYTDEDSGDTTTVYNILMESGQLFVDEAPVEMFIGETFIPSKDEISRGTQFMVIIQKDGDKVVLRTVAHTIYRD